MTERSPGDYEYGILNSIERPRVGHSLDWYQNDPWYAIKESVERTYVPDSLSNTGPYRGVVLRIEKGKNLPIDPETNQPYYPGVDDASNYIYSDQKPPELVRLKVRIPEIHVAIPVPEKFGDDATATPLDQRVIDMYPTFVAQSDLVVEPAVGDIVWVDYTNKNDWTDPIYIRPVTEKEYFINQVVPSIASKVMGPCDATSATVGGSTGDKAPGANASGNQPYPQGARKEPLGDTEIIEDTAMPPVAKLRNEVENLVNSVGLKAKGWVGRSPGNGGRQAIILAPKTTDFNKPIEISYWIHGAKSWFSANTPKFLLSDLKKLADQGRNIVLVYPQLPWPGPGKFSKFSNAGGGAGIAFNSGKGGNFANFHTEVVAKLQELFVQKPAELQVGFISIAAHSKGGQALKNMAQGGGLAAVKPDKIVCADSDYKAFSRSGDATRSIWDNYLSAAGKNVEWDLLCISPDRRPDDWPTKGKTDKKDGKEREGDNGNQPRKAMQAVMKNVFDEDVTNQKVISNKSITGGDVRVSYVPYVKTHSGIAFEAFKFIGPLADALPSENKVNSEEEPTIASAPEGTSSENISA